MNAQMLRIAEGTPAPVTDHESDDAEQIATRNTAEAAAKRLGFVALRKDTKFCNAACKQKTHRARQGVAA